MQEPTPLAFEFTGAWTHGSFIYGRSRMGLLLMELPILSSQFQSGRRHKQNVGFEREAIFVLS